MPSKQSPQTLQEMGWNDAIANLLVKRRTSNARRSFARKLYAQFNRRTAGDPNYKGVLEACGGEDTPPRGPAHVVTYLE